MQNDHALKNLIFDLLTHPQGRGRGVGKQDIWYSVSATMNLLNLIRNMTMF